MEISLLAAEDIAAAAGVFADHYRALRRVIPELPQALGNPAETIARLRPLQGACRALAACQGSRLLGYLGWCVIPNFRNAGRSIAMPPSAGLMPDARHCRHYSASPVFMAPMQPMDAAAFATFLSQPLNSVWLALEGERPAGFIRFEPGWRARDALAGAHTIGITGAYVRPEQRGKRLATAILRAALQAYEGLGFTRCAVDFEAFNPHAAAFWLQHFTPACYSVMRVPESLGPSH